MVISPVIPTIMAQMIVDHVNVTAPTFGERYQWCLHAISISQACQFGHQFYYPQQGHHSYHSYCFDRKSALHCNWQTNQIHSSEGTIKVQLGRAYKDRVHRHFYGSFEALVDLYEIGAFLIKTREITKWVFQGNEHAKCQWGVAVNESFKFRKNQ